MQNHSLHLRARHLSKMLNFEANINPDRNAEKRRPLEQYKTFMLKLSLQGKRISQQYLTESFHQTSLLDGKNVDYEFGYDFWLFK